MGSEFHEVYGYFASNPDLFAPASLAALFKVYYLISKAENE